MSNTPRVIFHNPGTLDPRAFQVMGLSAKDNASAIGFFGTGLKYAIAVILRLGGQIQIRTDRATYKFHKRPTTFRGKDFDEIYYTTSSEQNAQILPFTTHYGTNWELWQAYRELYCNARDEGGGVIVQSGVVETQPGNTYVIVDMHDMVGVHANHDQYFLPHTTPIAASKSMDVHMRNDRAMLAAFVHGINAGEGFALGTGVPEFTYNWKPSINVLTEDRTIKYTASYHSAIQHVWLNLFTKDQCKQFLPNLRHDSFEWNMKADSWTGSPSQDFIDAVRELRDEHRTVPTWALTVFNRAMPLEEILSLFEPTQLDMLTLKKAVSILNYHGCNIDIANIKFANELPDKALGMVWRGTIYISRATFTKGLNFMIGTLYEEWLHKTRSFEDCSREFQDFLIDQVATLMSQTYDMTGGK